MKNNTYDPKKIEKKWQKEWEKKKAFVAKENSKKKKFYALMEFPYPSGDGLHTGHVRGYTAMDVVARKRRMQGFETLFPIGFDAFGLPTENYAIKTGVAPEIVTKKNIKRYTEQFKSLGYSFDWSRAIDTTDPKYYKWTQWIFLKLLENGLAYKDKIAINWCPKDKIGLANEEVIGGSCERCGTTVEKREKEQWMLAITKYADKLDKDLDKTEFLEKIKIQQRNWIGRSEGAEIKFKIESSKVKNENQNSKVEEIEVFTTRPDTLFGVTYVVVAPEHELISKVKSQKSKLQLKIQNLEEIEKYIDESKKHSDIERTSEEKEKTGVEIKGIKAVNPANGEEVPVFVADYVLPHYGTGAVMAVPAHDERDFQFAKKYGLQIKHVVIPSIVDKKFPPIKGQEDVARKTIHAIVYDSKNDKYLCLNWKQFPWTTFIVGGIEEGEDPIEAARREVLEETGYKNLKFKRYLGGPVRAHYNAAHKKQNRIAYTHGIIFELENHEQDEISFEEKEKFSTEWFSLSEITETRMTCAELPEWLDRINTHEKAYLEDGILFNSGEFDGITSDEARKKITDFVGGRWVTKFKLRDWVFSRQRYWGEPIPVVHCEKCALSNPAGQGIVPLSEKDLPLKLPKVAKYQPTDTGESPLATMTKWVNVKCPKCGGKARRETDTMPNWAGSSWYYLAYTSRGISNFQFPISNKNSKNKTKSQARKNMDYWQPVDWYNGGMEHTTLHLLYSRFWNKFLYDIGVVPTSEPYKKRTSHGMILAGDGEKMSKSRGNVVNPDTVIETYGADTLRAYEMFMGPFDQAISWGEDNIVGVRRFLEKVWKVKDKVRQDKKVKINKEELKKFEVLLHKTIQKVSDDIESMSFNTAISSLMILTNEMEKMETILLSHFEIFLKLLSPFAPHITEEIWSGLGHKKMITLENWPKADKRKLIETTVNIAVQVNGKVRAELSIPVDAKEEAILTLVKKIEAVDKWISGKEVKKVIYVPKRLINIVI